MKKVIIVILFYHFCFAQSTEKLNFTSDFVQSLAHLKINQEKMDKVLAKSNSNEVEFIIDMMKTMKLNKMEIELAEKLLEPYLGSKDTLIKDVSSATIIILKKLNELQTEKLKILENLYNQNTNSLGTELTKVAEVKANEEIEMKSLMYITIGISHILISYDPDEFGKLSYLCITKQQRRSLINEIESIWGYDLQKDMTAGQSYLDGSVSMLYSFLKGEHKSADERK